MQQRTDEGTSRIAESNQTFLLRVDVAVGDAEPVRIVVVTSAKMQLRAWDLTAEAGD